MTSAITHFPCAFKAVNFCLIDISLYFNIGSTCEPWGGTLIFSHIRRLGPFFEVQNSEFNIFGGFQKIEYFWGIKILWIFLGVITKLG